MGSCENCRQIEAEKDARIRTLEQRQTEMEALLKFYEGQFKLSKARQFGPSSEKGDISEQIGLLFDEAENTADQTAPEPELEQITYTRRKRVGKREDDLSGLPVEVIEHTLPEEERVCPECEGPLHQMGHDSRKELAIIPAKVKIVEHRRAVYSCRNCEKNSDHVPIVKATTPRPMIKGSLASPSAVSHIMTQKYVMCAPLYRQAQDWKRQGVALSRQTMANWVIRCADDWLLPLYERLRKRLPQSVVLHADESTVQVLKEPGKPATSKSFMWLYRTSGDTNQHIVLFEYQPSRAGEHPRRFLEGFKGILHTDAYAGYNGLLDVTIVGCWAHMRRRFTNAQKVVSIDEKETSAAEAIKRIGWLFHLEGRWGNLTPKERYKRRLEESKPKAEAFFAWLGTLKVLPKSPMGKAVQYALEQKWRLMNVYLDGRAELSNNRAENAIRPFAVGRNYVLNISMCSRKRKFFNIAVSGYTMSA